MATNTPDKDILAEIADLYSRKDRAEKAERELAEERTAKDRALQDAEARYVAAQQCRQEAEKRAADAETRADQAEAHANAVERQNTEVRAANAELRRQIAGLERELGREVSVEETASVGTPLPFGFTLAAIKPAEGNSPPVFRAEGRVDGAVVNLTAHTEANLLQRIKTFAEDRARRKP